MNKNGLLKILMIAAETALLAETGGLSNTVLGSDSRAGSSFTDCNLWMLLSAVVRVMETCKSRDVWRPVQVRGMRAGFSRDRAARRAVELYQRPCASQIPRLALTAYEVCS
mgnify:CR=1 FL=1